LLDGQYNLSGNIPADGVTPNPFGLSTTPIVMSTGSGSLFFFPAAGTSINRDINVRGTGPGGIFLINTSTTLAVTYNGNIDLTRPVAFYGASSLGTAASIVVNGNITGTGQVTEQGIVFAAVSLNGNNSYSGGTNITLDTFAAGSNTAFGTGSIAFSGAGAIRSTNASARSLANSIFLAANPTFSGTGALTFTGPLNLNGARSLGFTNTGGTTFTNVISNGAFTKTGTQAVSLNSPTGNTYTGGTVLGTNAGILNVNNTSGSGTGAGAVSIGTSSTLSGNFIIAGNTTVNGNLSPGNSVGAANFLGNLTESATTVTTMEIDGTNSNDFLSVLATLTLAGNVNVVTTGGYVAQQNEVFNLIDWGSLTVSGFTVAANLNMSGAAVVGGETWDTSNFLVNGTVRVTPEPSSLLLAAVGGASLLRRRRSRKI
jgi:fibronectin-binding autotransporter adhesin